MNAGLAPARLSIAERQRLCAACRERLRIQYGVPSGIYLDGHRDAPRILDFFLREQWKQDVSVRVLFYDALDHEELELADEELQHIDFTWGNRMIYERIVLRVYNQTLPTGQGYHFDALVPTPKERKMGATGTSSARACWSQVAEGMEQANGRWTPTGSNAAQDDKVGGRPAKTTETEKGDIQCRDCGKPSSGRAQELLQHFFGSRGANIRIGSADAAEVVALWGDREALSLKLHTLQQAGLMYSDSGWHASNRLLEQWLAYYNSCSQGPGQRLGSSAAESTGADGKSSSAAESTGADGKIRADKSAAIDGEELKTTHASTSAERAGPEATSTKRCHVTQAGPAAKRLRGKQGATDKPPVGQQKEVDGDDPLEADEYILREWAARHGNPDPRAQQDAALQRLGQRLRAKPMLPPWLQQDAGNVAYDLPLAHCAFEGCTFEADAHGKLERHVSEEHGHLLAEVAACFPGTLSLHVRRMEAYRAAVTWACQQRAPCVHKAIDRRALKAFR